jgi:hypothetical protein
MPREIGNIERRSGADTHASCNALAESGPNYRVQATASSRA